MWFKNKKKCFNKYSSKHKSVKLVPFSLEKNKCKETEFKTQMRTVQQLGLVLLTSKSWLCSLIDSFTDEGNLGLPSLLFDTSLSFCASSVLFLQCWQRNWATHSSRQGSSTLSPLSRPSSGSLNLSRFHQRCPANDFLHFRHSSSLNNRFSFLFFISVPTLFVGVQGRDSKKQQPTVQTFLCIQPLFLTA